MSSRSRSASVPAPLRNLPIFWKLLLPFLVLLLLVGSAGAYIIVRDMTSRSAAALSEQLTLRGVDARSLVHDSELDLLESANYASNLQGMAEGLNSGDSQSVGGLLESVLALKPNLDVVAATSPSGVSLVEYFRTDAAAVPAKGSGTDWSAFPPVRHALDQPDPIKSAGFVRLGERVVMIMVSPICPATAPCAPLGFAIVGVDAGRVAARVAAAAEGAGRPPESVTLYDRDGNVLAATADAAPPPRRDTSPTEIEQHQTEIGGKRVAIAYTQFTLAGQPEGVVAVTIPATTAFGSVQGAALRLVGLVVLAMAAAVLVGAAVSRLILRQLRAVVQTSRELGAGHLSARAPVFSEDEHGELATALNRMAEQVEAEHATLELQVEQRTEEIRRLLRDRTEFFAGLSHELRTPLAIIITQAKMLLEDARGSAISGEAGATIEASASQLLELVNDILNLARAEAGSVDMTLRPVRLQELFADLTPMLVRLGAGSEIDVRVRIPRQLPEVTADPTRLQEVIVNLVGNAIKYTPSGGRCDLTASSDDDFVRVSVADTGVGIPPDVGDRVFEPFYLVPGTRPQRDQASSGLGLALARPWVKAMGGDINWAPNAGGGTVFTFSLLAEKGQRNGSTRGRVGAKASSAAATRPA